MDPSDKEHGVSDEMQGNENLRSGYVAIVGRPNVGKSSLLNRLLNEKISITSRKPQTTRHQILGVQTLGQTQIIYVDTPGMHIDEPRALNRYMNRVAKRALRDVDVILFVVDAFKWNALDEAIYNLIIKVPKPIILVINKTDSLSPEEKQDLLPYLKKLSEKYLTETNDTEKQLPQTSDIKNSHTKKSFIEIIPISAKTGTNVDKLQSIVAALMPSGPQYFPEEMKTDRSLRFRIAEIIREKLIHLLGEELPYSSTVEIETSKEENNVQHIHAIIWVEREGQKPIVIGKEGKRLKEIGIRARKDIERLLGKKVHLRLWVKVKGGWSDDDRALASLGYLDE